MTTKFRRIEEQEKVLNVFGKNAIISASAGSGKTSVLIRKISDYIENRNVDISNIIALTYTNAAAGEMKERLHKSLINSIEGESISEEERYLLSQQIDRISTADISTFHSFYERILKKYFYVIEIDPSFEILTNEENMVLKNSAFEEAIDLLKEKDFAGYLEMSDVLGKKRKDNAVKERIFKIDEFLSSQLNKDLWLNETALYMVKNKKDIYNILSAYLNEEIEEIISELDEIMSEFEDVQLNAYINKTILQLSEVKGLTFEEVYNKINAFSFPRLTLKLDDEKLDKIKAVRESFNNFKKRYKNTFGEFNIIEKSFYSCEKNINKLLSLYKDYNLILQSKKRELNKYSFSDLESFCFKVLENEAIKQDIQTQYKLIFIDEFQDTNPLQYEIIKKISKGNNIFIVGDPKQSIYAFRQSDVDIFNSVYEEYLSGDAKALSLRKNFRSNAKILDFANNIFDIIMTKDLSGIDYKKQARFEPESENDCENISVEISLVEKRVKQKFEKEVTDIYDIFADVSESEDRNLEAKLIVNQIGKVLKESIYDDKVGENRKIEYGDIAILMKDRSGLLLDLTKEFRKYNIPYLVNDRVDLLASKEVQLVISLIELSNNIKDDINLSLVLCSDFVGVTYNEASKIKKTFDEKYFHNSVFKYFKKETDEISFKLKKFFELIDFFNFNAKFKGVSLALNLLLSKCQILEKIKIKEKGNIRAEILQQFIAFIEQSPFNYDLIGLLNFVRNNKNIYVSSVKNSNLDVVKITTIHGSKGLEYPIVFLCDTGKDMYSRKPDMSDLKISKNLGIAIKNYDDSERKIYPSIFEEVMRIEGDKKNLAESFRLLYVALTRAKNKLFISGEFDINKKIDRLKINLLNVKPKNFINFIIGSMNENILETLNKEREYLDENLCISYISDDDFYMDISSGETAGKDFYLQQVVQFIESDKREYKYSNATTLSQKTTVTEIMTESDGYESLVYEPAKFTVNEHYKGLVTAEQGIIIHSILEKVDFRLMGLALEKDIEKNINIYNDDVMDYLTLKRLIENNVYSIKNLIPSNSKIFKEKMFMLNASLKDIYGQGSEEKVLIQGKIDLIAVGEKNILIDYKYTSMANESQIINKYIKQLRAYRFASEQALGVKIDEVYIFDIKKSKAIPITF